MHISWLCGQPIVSDEERGAEMGKVKLPIMMGKSGFGKTILGRLAAGFRHILRGLELSIFSTIYRFLQIVMSTGGYSCSTTTPQYH
jgi:hypothetical protein